MKKTLVFVGVVLVATICVTIAKIATMHHSTPVATIAGAPKVNPIAAVVQQIAAPDPIDLFNKSALRVLVVGLDYDYDDKDQEFSGASRSDIIMALNVDFMHHRVSELSVPRDMIATMPNGHKAKINQAQAEGGIAESQRVIAQWLGIPGFDRYVVLRIDTMKDLINAIGGINVVVKNSDCLRSNTDCKGGAVNYDDSWGHLHVHLTEGLHHLNGDQAVGYARFRHDWCSDPCRIMRQQDVVRSVVARLKGDKLNTMLHIVPLVHAINKDVQTNFTTREEISIAYAMRDLSPANIKTQQVPYTADVDLPDYGDSLVPDEDAKRHLVAQTFYAENGLAASTGVSSTAQK